MHSIVSYGNSGALLEVGPEASASGTCLFLKVASDAGGLDATGIVTAADFREPDFSLRHFRPTQTAVFIDACSSNAYPLLNRDVLGVLRPVDQPGVSNGPGVNKELVHDELGAAGSIDEAARKEGGCNRPDHDFISATSDAPSINLRARFVLTAGLP